jgi:hypothetical protein
MRMGGGPSADRGVLDGNAVSRRRVREAVGFVRETGGGDSVGVGQRGLGG